MIEYVSESILDDTINVHLYLNYYVLICLLMELTVS